jgi:hypothetical protein
MMGVTSTRLLRLNAESGALVKEWPWSSMREWHVNWEVGQFEVIFDGETLVFACVKRSDAKILHEFIGGYIYLSLRSKSEPSSLSSHTFFKLTDKR